MEIQWLSNSSFLIKTSTGRRIYIDPFDGFKIPHNFIQSDIITLSKNINKLTPFSQLNENVKIICDNSTYLEKDIKIKGYLSYSDKYDGLKRGINYIYTFEIDKIKLCHLGYLGHFLNDELLDTLNDVDYLFIPIGGEMCLNGLEASKLIRDFSAKYIIPMCFNSKGFDFYFNSPKDFLSNTNNILKFNSSIINTKTLPINNKFPLTLLLTL